MGYFEFLYGSGIICLPLNIPEKLQCNTHAPWRTAAIIETNGYQQHFSIGYQSSVWPRSDPFSWQNPCSGCNSGIDLVVALKYTFFQLCSNAEQISGRLARFRESSVKCPAVVLTSHTSYKAFLLDVRCAVQSGHVPFFAAVCPRW